MNLLIGFLSLAAAAAGLALAHCNRRAAGGALMALGATVFLGLLCGPTVELLMKHNPVLRSIALPRLSAVQAGWWGLSFVLGTGFGIRIFSGGRFASGRSGDWEIPADTQALDQRVRHALGGRSPGEETLIGLKKGGRALFLTPSDRQAHMQIIGPTRSGKSQLLLALAGQDMRRGMPVFLMEAKGDRGDFEQFARLASMAGKKSKLRYFNPDDERSMSFNPIRPLPGQDATAVANQIARAVGREPTATGDGQDYYRAVDYSRIANMAEVFMKSGREFTLRDCYFYFASEAARERALLLSGDPRLADMVRMEFEGKTDTSSLTAAFRPWITGRLGALLNSPDPKIRLEDVFEEALPAYIAVPVGALQALANPLGRMILSGLMAISGTRQKRLKKPPPASVILDEFAEFATPVFASFLATVGSARLWTILSHQDLGQLKRVQGMDPEAFRSAVYNNTSGCKVCFRTPDPADAEFWASAVGTFQTFNDTERIQKSLMGESVRGDSNRRSVEQFKIHPNQLKSLPPGTALAIQSGGKECLVRTARVFKALKPAGEDGALVGDAEALGLADAVPEGAGNKRFDHAGVPR